MLIVAVTVTTPGPVVFSVEPSGIVAPVVPAVLTLQTMVVLVALDGSTVPARVKDPPGVASDGTPVMFVTATNGRLTVMIKGWV